MYSHVITRLALRNRCALVVALAVGLLAAGAARAGTIGYDVPGGTDGNQTFGGELGMDFNVNSSITVTHLGVFDDDSNGLSNTITAHLWNRADTAAPLETLTFNMGATGHVVGGSRFLALATPVTLPAGFQGTISASGYGGTEENGNAGTNPPVWSTRDGGGLVAFVGTGRFGAAGSFPVTADGPGSVNRYAAGTFVYEQTNPVVAYAVNSATTGTQNFGGSLGMDFQTNRPVEITHLGVFDSEQDGVSGTLWARLYARGPGNTGVELAQLSFTGTEGQLIGGSRLKALATPLALPGGFAGTIVAEGYNAAELNGNSDTPTQWWTEDGGGALSFVGSSRYGLTPGVYPPTPDGGPANRYAAGTFTFDTSKEVLPRGGISTIHVPNGSFEQPPRPQQPNGAWYGAADNWTHYDSGDAGHFHPAAGIFTDPIPDGSQVGYVNGGRLVSDPVGTLQKDTLYILDVDWGHRTDGGTPNHSMNLRAGGVVLGWLNDSNMRKGPPVGPGQFEANRLYATANHNATIGSPLDIQFTTGSAQAIYDNVRLTQVTGAAVLLNNPSFELDPVATNGWRLGAVGWQSTASPNSGVVDMASQITPADGEQCAFIEHGGSLTQTLSGVPLQAGWRYVLLAEVADGLATPFAGYGLELLAGGQVVGADYDTFDVLETDPKFYVTSVVDVRIGSSHPLLGQDLGIRLTAPISAGEAYFDNVRLFAFQVPEPATLALLGLGAAGLGEYLRRRRA